MVNNKSKVTGYAGAFILGGLVGSSITLLLSPFSGKEFRGKINEQIDNSIKRAKQKELEIINKARAFSDDLVLKAEQLVALIDKYSTGTYLAPVEKVEKEIKSFKAGINAAMESYKKGNGKPKEENTKVEIVEDIFPEYNNEKLPKRESMRKRVRRK